MKERDVTHVLRRKLGYDSDLSHILLVDEQNEKLMLKCDEGELYVILSAT
jgi:hypothetical protein